MGEAKGVAEMLRIKDLRHSKGISIRKLAELTGLSRSSLNDLENNKKIPNHRDLELIAKALGVTQEELWTNERR